MSDVHQVGQIIFLRQFAIAVWEMWYVHNDRTRKMSRIHQILHLISVHKLASSLRYFTCSERQHEENVTCSQNPSPPLPSQIFQGHTKFVTCSQSQNMEYDTCSLIQTASCCPDVCPLNEKDVTCSLNVHDQKVKWSQNQKPYICLAHWA